MSLQERAQIKSVLTFSLSNVIFSGRDVRQAGIYSQPGYEKLDSSLGRSNYHKGDGYKTGEMKQCPSQAPSGPYSAWKGNSLVTGEGARSTTAGAKARTAVEASSLLCNYPGTPAAQHP